MNRETLIGFVVPIYGALAVADMALTEAWKPHYFDALGVVEFVALIPIAAILGVSAAPLRHSLFKLAAGGMRWTLFPYGRAIKTWRDEIEEVWVYTYDELWPLIRSLTDSREQSYLDDAETDAAALLISALSAIGISITVAVDRGGEWWLLLIVAGVFVSVFLYWQAIEAVKRVGVQSRCAVSGPVCAPVVPGTRAVTIPNLFVHR